MPSTLVRERSINRKIVAQRFCDEIREAAMKSCGAVLRIGSVGRRQSTFARRTNGCYSRLTVSWKIAGRSTRAVGEPSQPTALERTLSMATATPVLVTLLVCLLFSGRAHGQDPSRVESLLSNGPIRTAIELARSAESRTIDDQVRFCEVPAPPFEEAARAELLRRTFLDMGLSNVRLDRVGNVVGDRPGTTERPRLVVAAHLDTVFSAGTPVSVTRDARGVLRGPGIGDNCRGLAVLVSVVRAMNAAAVQTSGPITFVANVGEEGLGDLRGVKALFTETMKGRIDRFVSIDGGGLYVTNVGVGSHRYRVTFKGPGGHSFGAFGLPSPANALGRAIAKIAEISVPSTPRTTFNVGRVGGGTSVNAIPAEAWMEIDMRSSDAAQLMALDTKVQAAIDAAVSEENRRWKASSRVTAVKELVGDRPAGSLSSTSPIVLTVQAAGRALGLHLPLGEGSTDANLALSLGVPGVAIGGGGEGFDVHAVTESWDSTDSWKGTQTAVLAVVALAQP